MAALRQLLAQQTELLREKTDENTHLQQQIRALDAVHVEEVRILKENLERQSELVHGREGEVAYTHQQLETSHGAHAGQVQHDLEAKESLNRALAHDNQQLQSELRRLQASFEASAAAQQVQATIHRILFSCI